jgi:hypothetical protein
MSETVAAVVLWLFIVNLGIAFGAGLYEHRIVLSRWLQPMPPDGLRWDGEAVRRDDAGRRFWGFVTTLPLTLLTFLSLWAAIDATGTLRAWWLAASAAALGDRLLTFFYFIPTMIGLMQATDSPAAVVVATRWRTLNYLRLALVFIAWLAAMKAFALFYRAG